MKPESLAPKESKDPGGVTVSLHPARSACVGSRGVCLSTLALPFLVNSVQKALPGSFQAGEVRPLTSLAGLRRKEVTCLVGSSSGKGLSLLLSHCDDGMAPHTRWPGVEAEDNLSFTVVSFTGWGQVEAVGGEGERERERKD